jgi:hypothetical protein
MDMQAGVKYAELQVGPWFCRLDFVYFVITRCHWVGADNDSSVPLNSTNYGFTNKKSFYLRQLLQIYSL